MNIKLLNGIITTPKEYHINNSLILLYKLKESDEYKEVKADFISSQFLVPYIYEKDIETYILYDNNIIFDISNEYIIMCWKYNIYYYNINKNEWDIITTDSIINSMKLHDNVIYIISSNKLLRYSLNKNEISLEYKIKIEKEFNIIGLCSFDNSDIVGILFYNNDKFKLICYNINNNNTNEYIFDKPKLINEINSIILSNNTKLIIVY